GGFFAQAQFRRDAAAERFTVGHDLTAVESLLPQPLVRRLGVAIRRLLAEPAFAAPVAAVIEGENTGAGFEQRAVEFEPMADVSRVAVGEQDNAGAGGIGGKIPSVQPRAIGGRKKNILEGAPQFPGAGGHLAAGPVDPAVFKAAQHRAHLATPPRKWRAFARRELKRRNGRADFRPSTAVLLNDSIRMPGAADRG